MDFSIDIESLRPIGYDIPLVSTQLNLSDYLGAIKGRWGIGRDHYTIVPGLYKVGKPNHESDVFVSANYKLSFDALRKNLDSINAWILVIDTKGINVWCAAGKGTFGTDILMKSIKTSSLENIVSHHTIIVPQLGAVGVAAHVVKERSGFRVIYGPVMAKECGACALNCQFGAITVKSGVGCAAGIINGYLRNTDPSCDCSGDGKSKNVCC